MAENCLNVEDIGDFSAKLFLKQTYDQIISPQKYFATRKISVKFT